MEMERIFEAALNIQEPWYISKVAFDASRKRLDLRLDFRKGSTFKYDENGVIGEYKAYDTVEKEWRHLNFFEHECYLTARVPRIKTSDNKTHLIQPPWNGLQNGFTLLFEAFILQLSKGMPVHLVGELVHTSDYKVWSILDKYIEKARENSDYSHVTEIGMDETSIAKGHDYISLFVDLKRKKTIFVTEGKDHGTVNAFKADFERHNGNVSNITDVSCDMSPAFIKGIKENLPEAKITFDKFHIVKIINKSVDDVRRAEIRINPLLTGSRYIFLKNDKNLTVAQRQKKEELLLSNLNIKSMEALNMRETFQQIYAAPTEELFEELLVKWYDWVANSDLEPMVRAAQTIRKHWDGIIQWKKSNINNGILEGLNSVIQAAKRKARGYKAKHFKTIAYLITGGLDFRQINPACLPT